MMGSLAQLSGFETQKFLTKQSSNALKAGRTYLPVIGVMEVWIFPKILLPEPVFGAF